MAAPLIVVGGQVVGDPTLYQPWDPSLMSNPDAAAQINRGCAPGWATIFVEDPMTSGTARVCRLLDASVTGPNAAQTIRNETGPDLYDQSIINIADALAAIPNALPSLPSVSFLLIAPAVLLFCW